MGALYTTVLTETSHGTENGGNRFPGVVAGEYLIINLSTHAQSLFLTAPFAMAKLGPDVQDGNTDAYSGYWPTGKIWGYSMMHESGTGGAPKLVF